MPRDDWRERDEPWRGDHGPRGEGAPREDYGQADYSERYGYDPRTRTGFRAGEPDPRQPPRDWTYDDARGRIYRPAPEPVYPRSSRDAPPRPEPGRAVGRDPREPMDDERSWSRDDRDRRDPPRRRGPSDRVLWAVIVERLEDERGLDLRDVEVLVEDAEVTLNGEVRRKDDKRRIEDIADIDGVRHVQNNLRVRERGRWTFL